MMNSLSRVIVSTELNLIKCVVARGNGFDHDAAIYRMLPYII